MIRIILTGFLLSISILGYSQDDKMFPYMEAETLTNKMIDLPKDLAGSYSLLALAYSKKSESLLSSWFQPLYQQFIAEPDPNAFFAIEYELDVYFIPMFTGAKRAAYQKTMKKLKETVDPKMQDNVLFYKGTLKEYKKALDFQGMDLPYFYVLDKEGKIVYTTTGKYTRQKMQEIIDAINP